MLYYRLHGIDFMLSVFSSKGSSGCQNKESYCEVVGPDCNTPQVQHDCNKYCGLCQRSSCMNREPWCEYAKPDCKRSRVKKSCKKFCGLCKSKKLNKLTK